MLIASLTSGQFHGLRFNSRRFNYALPVHFSGHIWDGFRTSLPQPLGSYRS
jgi:hypothetical protein